MHNNGNSSWSGELKTVFNTFPRISTKSWDSSKCFSNAVKPCRKVSSVSSSSSDGLLR